MQPEHTPKLSGDKLFFKGKEGGEITVRHFKIESKHTKMTAKKTREKKITKEEDKNYRTKSLSPHFQSRR